VNNATPEPLVDEALSRHLGNLWKRIIPLENINLDTGVTGVKVIRIPHPFEFGSTGNSFAYGNILMHMAQLYAGFRGDVIYNINIEGSGIGSYRAWLIAAEGSAPPTFSAIAALVPGYNTGTLITGGDEWWPSRAGFTGNPGFVEVPASYPIIEVEVPGTARVVRPFTSNNRFIGVPGYPGADINTAVESVDNENLYIIISTSMPSQPFNVTVYAQMGDGAKCGIFTGVPTLYLDLLTNGSSTTQYPGSFFQLP